MSSRRPGIKFKISQIVKIKEITRRWHKLGGIPAAISGIKRALWMIFSYHYDQRKELKISGDSESTPRSVPDDVREGHLAVYAGKEEELLERFVIPVAYLNHPLFLKLLHNAKEEFGFNYPNGRLTLPFDPTVLASTIDIVMSNGNYHYNGAETRYLLA